MSRSEKRKKLKKLVAELKQKGIKIDFVPNIVKKGDLKNEF